MTVFNSIKKKISNTAQFSSTEKPKPLEGVVMTFWTILASLHINKVSLWLDYEFYFATN
jgi:hypothetical protein